MKTLIIAVAAVVAMVLASAAKAADAPATQPATPAVSTVKGTITQVQGLVRVRLDEDKPWVAAAVGMEITEGSEFQTGPRSFVKFKIPPDQVITLDRLGTVKVLEAINPDAQNAKVALGMKYGRTDYKVEGEGVSHDVSIRTPAATLAVRGTDHMWMEDTGFYPTNAGSHNTPFNFNGSNFGSNTGNTNVNEGDQSTQDRNKKDTNNDNQNDQTPQDKDLTNELPGVNGSQLGGVNNAFQNQTNTNQFASNILSNFQTEMDVTFLLTQTAANNVVGVVYNGHAPGNINLTLNGFTVTLTNLQNTNTLQFTNNNNPQNADPTAFLGVKIPATGGVTNVQLDNYGDTRTVTFTRSGAITNITPSPSVPQHGN